MKKIEYFCCLLGLVLTGLACQDDDCDPEAGRDYLRYGNG